MRLPGLLWQERKRGHLQLIADFDTQLSTSVSFIIMIITSFAFVSFLEWNQRSCSFSIWRINLLKKIIHMDPIFGPSPAWGQNPPPRLWIGHFLTQDKNANELQGNLKVVGNRATAIQSQDTRGPQSVQYVGVREELKV